jgi:hypothetical protein
VSFRSDFLGRVRCEFSIRFSLSVGLVVHSDRVLHASTMHRPCLLVPGGGTSRTSGMSGRLQFDRRKSHALISSIALLLICRLAVRPVPHLRNLRFHFCWDAPCMYNIKLFHLIRKTKNDFHVLNFL